MKKIFILITFVLAVFLANAQMKTNQAVSGGSINTSSAFLDASSSTIWNASTNLGKGLLFPRVNLVTFTTMAYGGTTGLGTNYPTRFDGMIVYNSATGTAALGSTPVTPGFYYYSNKSTTANGGTWVRMLDNNVLSSDVTYYGVLATTTPTATDITGLANKKSLASGVYTGNLDLTVSTAGYFTVAIPASWRNPSLKIDGNETMNVMQLVSQVVINNVNYQVWQTDVSLPGGKLVSIN